MTELIAIVTKILAVVVTLTGLYSSLDARVAVVEQKLVNQTSSVFGSVTGPDSPFQTETHNNLRYDYYRTNARTATSTLCSFKTPNATSTLVSAKLNITSGNTYSNTYQIGWSLATQGAITTMIAQKVAAANVSSAIVATSTGLVQSIGGGVEGVVPPNTIINFIISTTTAVTLAPIGSCSLVTQGF